MHEASILDLSVRVLAAAVAVVLVCLRLRVAPVAGLLVAGALIGPSGLGWVTDIAGIQRFAEIGVMLLLFAIGLELSKEKLRELGRMLAVGGPLQAALTGLAAGTLAWFLGPTAGSLGAAVLVGGVVTLSSTALVLKLYGDRGELESLHGRAALGILVFQDLLVVPLIVLLPALGEGASRGSGAVALRLASGFAAVALAVVVGRAGVPQFFRVVARGKSREAFLLSAVALCLGFAWLSEHLGLSPALGAFLAGLLLADSDYAHQALAEVAPLREIFASLFFVSIGLLVDLSFLVREPVLAVGLTVAIVLGKSLAAGAAVAALGVPVRAAAVAALGLAQIGELSFVLLSIGRSSALIDDAGYQLLLTAAALSLLVTPAMVAVAPRLGDWCSRRLTPSAPPNPPESLVHGQVLVVGYGANGEILARILRESRVRYTILDGDSERVRRGRAAGEPIVFGDAGRPEILRHAGVDHARIVVVAISDPHSVTAVVHAVRKLAPAAQILVRTRRLRDTDRLLEAGADRVVAEEYESAIEIYTWVLEQLHVPRNVIAAQTRAMRGGDYLLLRGASRPTELSRAVAEALATGTTDVFRITDGSPAAGRTLAELDLRRRTGATVIAVVRGEAPTLTPAADHRLAEGDELVLVGAHAELEAAFVALVEPGAAS
jgi:CPA2 family monovalent cation:H+ antiporter-2